MSTADDIARIKEQEKALVFPEFSEDIAFRLGLIIRENAVAAGHTIATEIRTGDRKLFYTALTGTSADNDEWLRRKANLVHRVYKPTYRVVLEHQGQGDFFGPRRGLDNADFVLAGGGFPIRVKNAGFIGSVAISGLHERDDHRLVVEAICQLFGIDVGPLALPPIAG